MKYGASFGSTTSIVNVRVSLSPAPRLPSESVTVYVYVVASCSVVGVPDSTRVEELKVTPAGHGRDSEYLNVPLPPVATGSVTDTRRPLSHTWFDAVPLNAGARSTATLTVAVLPA